MHAARRRHDDIGLVEAEPLDQLADAARRRLHPFETLGMDDVALAVGRRLRAIEKDVGSLEMGAPARRLLGAAGEGCALMVRHIAQRRIEVLLIDHLEPRDRADALDMLGLERRGDEEAWLGHRLSLRWSAIGIGGGKANSEWRIANGRQAERDRLSRGAACRGYCACARACRRASSAG